MYCSQCGTDDVQRVEMTYMEGKQNIDTVSKTIGAGVGRSGGGTGVGLGGAKTNTSGTATTVLADSIAPPEEQPMGLKVLLVLGGIGLAMYGSRDSNMLLFGILLGGVSGYFLYKAIQYNWNVYPKLLKQWQKTWICKKCGHVFLPEG